MVNGKCKMEGILHNCPSSRGMPLFDRVTSASPASFVHPIGPFGEHCLIWSRGRLFGRERSKTPPLIKVELGDATGEFARASRLVTPTGLEPVFSP